MVSTSTEPSLVVIFSADRELIQEVGVVVQGLDCRLGVLSSDQDLERGSIALGGFEGSGARLLEWLTRSKPALMVFDLSAATLPWQNWLPLVKADPATRRTPVICVGAPGSRRGVRQALTLGADVVLARSRFQRSMRSIIRRYLRPIPYATYQRECSGVLSPQAVEGIELFNRGEYFEAHEALELAWNEESTPGRDLYRALLQVAVCYLQIERRNYRGALKMFLRLRQWLDPLPSLCRGVDIQQLKQEVGEVYQQLLLLGPDRLDEFDRRLFRPIRVQN